MSLVSDGQKTQKHFHHENDGEKNMIMMMVMMVMVMLMGDGDDGKDEKNKDYETSIYSQMSNQKRYNGLFHKYKTK